MITAPLTGQDIGEAEGAVRALLEQILAHTGRTSDEYIALRVLTVRPPMLPAELVDFLTNQRQLRLERDGAVALLEGLSAAGLVTGLDAESGPVALTEAGAATSVELVEAVSTVAGGVFAGIDPAALETAKQVLHEVVEKASVLRRELVDAS